MTTIVWFRQDLRLADNPALRQAAQSGAILPVYILEAGTKGAEREPLGGASRWWLHHSLTALETTLGGLAVFKGDPCTLLPDIMAQTGAPKIVWNRCYEPAAIERDTAIKTALADRGFSVESFNASLLTEPWQIKTLNGGPFKVFTPFWRALQKVKHAAPLKAPKITLDTKQFAKFEMSVSDLELLPTCPDWAAGWEKLWQPGEEGATERLRAFSSDGLMGYADAPRSAG